MNSSLNGEQVNQVSEVNSTCRSCLTSSFQVRSVYGCPLAEQMWECAQIRIAFNDGLPDGLCPKCRAELEVAHSFRIRSQRSDALLRQFKIERADHVDVKFAPSIKEERSSPEHFDLFDSKPEDPPSCSRDDPVDSDQDRSNRAEKVSRKEFCCSICGKMLCSNASLEYHMVNLHGGEKKNRRSEGGRRHRCSECPYSTRRSQGLLYHMRTHTGEKPFKCDVCDFAFAQPGPLKNHKRTHSDQTYYTCDECGKQFKFRTTYGKHRLVHLKARDFICDICNKGLRTKETLIAHLNRHNNVKNFFCETCGAAFVTNGDLYKHSKKHNKYSCDVCDFKTYARINLKNHQMTHRDGRPFKCDLCDLPFLTKSRLKRHRAKHAEGKKYPCPICETKFVRAQNVGRHLKAVHGVKCSAPEHIQVQ